MSGILDRIHLTPPTLSDEIYLDFNTPGQVAACTAMLGSEAAHRDGAKRARLLRQARFPVPKALDGFDWSNVAFPDGWGRDEMCSLAFVCSVK